MKRTLMILLCVAACSEPTYYPATDLFGNVYPPECRRDLSDVKAAVLYVEPEEMDKIRRARKEPRRLWGLTWGGKLIMIDSTLTGWVRDEVLHHERCHVLAGAWHRDAK